LLPRRSSQLLRCMGEAADHLLDDLRRRSELRARFDRIFRRSTGFATLDRLLQRLHANKAELLMVLDHPEIPLHTNGSENDIRCQVTKRQVSGGTHSDIGRDCRDAFLGLAKTCRKLGSSPDLTQCRPGFCSDYFCIRHVTDFADVFEGVSPTLKGGVNPPNAPSLPLSRGLRRGPRTEHAARLAHALGHAEQAVAAACPAWI
jgi:hypothetical protein